VTHIFIKLVKLLKRTQSSYVKICRKVFTLYWIDFYARMKSYQVLVRTWSEPPFHQSYWCMIILTSAWRRNEQIILEILKRRSAIIMT